MKFFQPWILVAAASLPLLAAWCHGILERRARRKLDGLLAPRLRERLLQSVDGRKRWLKVLMLALACGLFLVALARPQHGLKPIGVETGSVDFIIGLDLSRSMLAEDVESKSRLVQAKAGIVRMLDELGADRAGLIGFAGEAFLAAPMTQDHESVKRNMEPLEPSVVAKQGTDMAKAIELALKTFKAGKHDTQALVLITDGEQLQGDAMLAAQKAAQQGMRVFAVGVGSITGARIPERRRGVQPVFARNEFGGEVMTRMNEHMLRQLAASGRGFYVPLGTDGAGLREVWKRGLEPLAKTTQARASKDLEDYFQWPLAIALAILLLEMLVSDRRRKPQSATA